MTAFYNEIDPFAAEWLRELIKAGAIAPGIVDERSVEDIAPDELDGFTQCHFFAGIGVWSYALRQSGWPDGRPVWTGSCPCQPFSAAGKGAGFADERHLWPAFFHLIEQCRPAIVFGEQVASKAVEPWIDLVQTDLEAVGYAFGCVPFPSASVGAPHIRDRAYWVADADKTRREDAERWTRQAEQERGAFTDPSCRVVHSNSNRQKSRCSSTASAGYWDTVVATSWDDFELVECSDGKHRPTKRGVCPLAYGASNPFPTIGPLGNAINAEAAKAFITAFMGAA